VCKELGYVNLNGVEAIPECVAYAQEHFDIQVTQGEIVAYLEKVANNSCDIITAFDVMEHFKKADLLSVLQLVYQKLKPGGKFIMHVPNGGSLSGLYILFSDLTHEWAFAIFMIVKIANQ
jgi:predicted SAM-dependent methyltransferase